MLEKLLFKYVIANDADKLDLLLSTQSKLGEELKDINFLITDLVNTQNTKLETPLYLAVCRNQEAIVNILIRYGADTNIFCNGKTVLHLAVENNNLNIVNLLIKSKSNINATTAFSMETALHIAIRQENEVIVQLLIEANADLTKKNANESTPLLLSMYCTLNDNICNLLLDAGADVNTLGLDQRTPLDIAVFREKIEMVELLIRKGAKVNLPLSDGGTALHIAANTNKNADIVKLLLNENADINAITDNDTPLMLAIKNPSKEVAKYLIKAGADVNIANKEGATPLNVATYHGYEELVDLLIAAKADIENLVEGVNMLHVAVENGLFNIVNKLLLAHAKIHHVVDKVQKTAAESAFEKKDSSIIELFLDYGAGLHLKIDSNDKLTNVNFKDKIVIGMYINKRRVTREIPQLRHAITNIKEFIEAVNNNVPFNRKALFVTCNQLLEKYPNRKDIQNFKTLLWLLPANKLTNLCINRLNKPDLFTHRTPLLDKQSIFPDNFKTQLNPNNDPIPIEQKTNNPINIISSMMNSFRKR